jgi:gliding motility-associated-like protein
LPVMVTGDIASYQWTPSTGLDNPAKEEPSASPDTSTLYTLHAVSTSGCVGSGSIDVNVETKVLVPNAFSPNGDGIHDTWNITGLNGYPGATVDVFNRWGQLVFHSEGYSNPWDGRYSGGLVPTGTYYYVIDPKNNKSKMKGPLTIFR